MERNGIRKTLNTQCTESTAALTSSKELSSMAAIFIAKPARLLPSVSFRELLLCTTCDGTRSGSTLHSTLRRFSSLSTASVGNSFLGKNISTGNVQPVGQASVSWSAFQAYTDGIQSVNDRQLSMLVPALVISHAVQRMLVGVDASLDKVRARGCRSPY